MSIWDTIEDSILSIAQGPKKKPKKKPTVPSLGVDDFIGRERQRVSDAATSIPGLIGRGANNLMNVVAAPSRLTNAALRPGFFQDARNEYLHGQPLAPPPLNAPVLDQTNAYLDARKKGDLRLVGGILGLADSAFDASRRAMESNAQSSDEASIVAGPIPAFGPAWGNPIATARPQPFEEIAGPLSMRQLSAGKAAQAQASQQAEREHSADPENEIFTSWLLKDLPLVGDLFNPKVKTVGESVGEAGFGTGAQLLSELGNPANYLLDPLYLAAKGAGAAVRTGKALNSVRGLERGVSESVSDLFRSPILRDAVEEAESSLALSKPADNLNASQPVPDAQSEPLEIPMETPKPASVEFESPLLQEIMEQTEPMVQSLGRTIGRFKETSETYDEVLRFLRESPTPEPIVADESLAASKAASQIPETPQARIEAPSLEPRVAKKIAALEARQIEIAKMLDEAERGGRDLNLLTLSHEQRNDLSLRRSNTIKQLMNEAESNALAIQSLRDAPTPTEGESIATSQRLIPETPQARIEETPTGTPTGEPNGLPGEIPMPGSTGLDFVPPSGTDIATGTARPGPAAQVLAAAERRGVPLGPGQLDEALSEGFANLEAKRIVGEPIPVKPPETNSGLIEMGAMNLPAVARALENLAQKVGDKTIEPALRRAKAYITDAPLDLTRPIYHPKRWATDFVRLSRRYLTEAKGVPQRLEDARQEIQKGVNAYSLEATQRATRGYAGDASAVNGQRWGSVAAFPLDEAQRIAMNKVTEWGEAVANQYRKLDPQDPLHVQLQSALSTATTKEDIASIIGSQQWGEYEGRVLKRLYEQAPLSSEVARLQGVPTEVWDAYKVLGKEYNMAQDNLAAEVFRLDRDAFQQMDMETRLLAMQSVRRGAKGQLAMDKFIAKNDKQGRLSAFRSVVDNAAAEARAMRLSDGDTLIDEILSPEAYAEHKGTHAPFLYHFHENGLRGDQVVSWLDSVEAGGTRITPETRQWFVEEFAPQNQGRGQIMPEEFARLKARKDLSPEVKQLLGLIEDPQVVKVMDLVHMRRLQELMKLRRLALSEDHMVSRVGESLEDFAARAKITPGMAWKTHADQALKSQWGPLYGRFVHPDLADWMTAVAPALGGKAIPYLDAALQKWSWMHTVASPPTHFKQWIQNASTAHVEGGVSAMGYLPESFSEVFNASGRSYDEARKAGLFSGSGIDDVKRAIGGLVEAPQFDPMEHWAQNFGKMGEWAKKVHDVAEAAGKGAEMTYQMSDSVFKLLHFKRLRAMNYAPEAAAHMARNMVYSGRPQTRAAELLAGKGLAKSIAGGYDKMGPVRTAADAVSRVTARPFVGAEMFNFSKLPGAALGIRSGSLTPGTDLGKAMRAWSWMLLPAGISAVSSYFSKDTTPEQEAKGRPLWMNNRTSAFIPPMVTQYLTGQGDGGHMDLSWMIPFSTPLERSYDPSSGSYRNQALSRFANPFAWSKGGKEMPLNPLLQPLIEGIENQDHFTGEQLYNPNEVSSDADRVRRIAKHVARQYFSPSAPIGPALGFADQRKSYESIGEYMVRLATDSAGPQASVLESGAAQTIADILGSAHHFHDYKGRERHLAEAILATLGFRLYPMKPNAGETQRAFSTKAQIEEARRSGKSGVNSAIGKRNDPEEAQYQAELQAEKITKLDKAYRSYTPSPSPGFDWGINLRKFMERGREKSQG